MNSRAVLAVVVLVAVLIGGNFTALKFALDHSTPLLLAGLRTVIGGSFLLAFAFLRGETFPTNKRDLFNIFIVSFSITTVSSGFLVFGVSRVTAGVASLIASTMPLFTAVLALLLMRTAISRLAIIGLGVGFVGTLVLASPSLGGASAAVGIASLLVAALAWAFGNVYMKWQDMTNVSPIMLVGVQLYMSALCLIPFALVVGRHQRHRVDDRAVRPAAVCRHSGQRGHVCIAGDGGPTCNAHPGSIDGLLDPGVRRVLRLAHSRRTPWPRRSCRRSADHRWCLLARHRKHPRCNRCGGQMTALRDLVVVTFAGSMAGAYCAKMFADGGARVMVVGQSDLGRHQQAYLYANCEMVELDDVDFETSDVVIESSAPAPLDPIPLPHQRLVRVQISPFGLSGDRAHWHGTDLVDYAASGHAYLYGDPEREPLRGPPDQPAVAAGLYGFVGAMAALLARDRVGRGQTVEISHVQVMTALHQVTLLRWFMTGDVFCRMGNRYTGQGQPNGPYRCRDGWISITAVTQPQVERAARRHRAVASS